MAGIDFSSLTPKNGAVQELAELIFLELIEDDKLGQLVTFMPAQENGKKLGFVGKAGLLGKKAKGCDPEYAKNLVQASEKTWDLQEWEIAEEICYKELENTIAEHFAANGSDMADLTDSDYMDNVVRPILEQAIRDLMIRFAFFGDTEAEGTLKDGVDPEYFDLVDGIFKQLFTSVTAGTTPHVTIAANSEATIAAQLTAINSEAKTALDGMIAAANPALRQASDQVIYMTQAMASGLEAQLLANCCGSDLAWTAIFGGIRETTYRGIKIRVVPQWDEIIQSYEGNGTAYNLPFRAIYTTERNLALGVNGTDEFAGLRITFDPVTLYNYIYATDKMGALVLDNKMAVIGY